MLNYRNSKKTEEMLDNPKKNLISVLVEFDKKETIINELLDKLSSITNILTKIVKSSTIKC